MANDERIERGHIVEQRFHSLRDPQCGDEPHDGAQANGPRGRGQHEESHLRS